MVRLLRTLLLVGGAAVLVVLVARVGPAVILDMLRRVGWGFAVATLLYSAHLAVRAAALWRSLPVRSLTYSSVLQVRVAGEAVETLTFTGPFLAEPAKGWLLAERGADGADAFGAVAIEYLLYTLVSAWLATAALSVLLTRGALPGAMRGPVIGIIAGMGVFTAGVAVAAVTGVGLLVPVIRRAGAIVGRQRAAVAVARIDPVERVLIDFMHRRPARLTEVILIEAAGHALLALEIAVVLGALAVPFRVSDPLIIEGGTKFISVAFFFIPGQMGASEGIYALLFRAAGFTGAAGLTMALVRRVRALMVAATGVAVLALARRGRS
jgi:Lysylphosphatidylglycerol synthase TM region